MEQYVVHCTNIEETFTRGLVPDSCIIVGFIVDRVFSCGFCEGSLVRGTVCFSPEALKTSAVQAVPLWLVQQWCVENVCFSS